MARTVRRGPGCREERSPLRCSIRRPSDPGGGDARPRPGRGYREESDLPVIGVLALQGDVREHLRALDEAGADAVPVRRLNEIEACDGLVIPGGESTTLWRLATALELMDPLRKLVACGLPAFGSCAG